MVRSSTLDVGHLILSANLREFGAHVQNFCALQEAGRLTAEQCFTAISSLWSQLAMAQTALDGCDPCARH